VHFTISSTEIILEILIKFAEKLGEIVRLFVISPGFFFRPEASAPWMAKGVSPLQLSQGGRAPGRNEKAREGLSRKKTIIQRRVLI
jgi:hypothetical protein